MAGIKVFATGGIGGVHRGAETTMDISADLEELASTPVMVVCAGAKSILDLGLTLEYLETHGVPVIGVPVMMLSWAGCLIVFRRLRMRGRFSKKPSASSARTCRRRGRSRSAC